MLSPSPAPSNQMLTQISQMLWLKWKLMMRGYLRNTSALIGVLVALVFLLPASLGVAGLLGFAFVAAPAPVASLLLIATLTVFYLIWIIGPLIGYQLNESYDLTRLFVYPAAPLTLLIGSTAGYFTDFPMLLGLPSFVAIFVGFIKHPLAIAVTPAALALFIIHTLAISQAILLASGAILRSRRFRELAVVFAALLGMGVYAGSHLLMRSADRIDWRAIAHSTPVQALGYFPPGLTARAIAGGSRGDTAAAAIWLGVLLAVALISVGLAAVALDRAYTGSVSESSSRRSPRMGNRTSRLERFADWLFPPVVAAVFAKDLRYMFREPYFKVVLLNLAYIIVLYLVIVIGPFSGDQAAVAAPLALCSLALISELHLPFNIFGNDGPASQALFTLPSSRRQIIIGKNAALFAALTICNLVLVTFGCLMTGALHAIGMLVVLCMLGLVAMFGVGNICSVVVPHRLTMTGRRMRTVSAGKGCAMALQMSIFSFAAMLLLLPIIAACGLPLIVVSPVWLGITVPLALIYAVVIYYASLQLAESLLLKREVEVAAALSEEV